ncbi:MAG: S24 family peptidase [Eubacteriales bacterium]|nr:S24 family peptidase [Eubacteriales bacterium]
MEGMSKKEIMGQAEPECNGEFLCYAHLSDIMLPDEYSGMKNRDGLYMQIAHGDGMSLAGISDGDVLVLDKEATPVDGDIVTLSIDGSTQMCRRFYRKDNRTWFRREDGVTPDIAPDNFTIHAVVIGVMKVGRFSASGYDPDIRLTR